MTVCCPTPGCSLKNEKSQESLCLISHFYGWNCPSESDAAYLWLSRTSFQGRVTPPGLAPGNLCSLKPSQAPACHHPFPEIVFLPYLTIQMLHYQKNLPRPQCLKYIFPYHTLPPLCWVVFLHSSHITFNVSLSFVCLSLLREDWDFICVVFYYVPGPWDILHKYLLDDLVNTPSGPWLPLTLLEPFIFHLQGLYSELPGVLVWTRALRTSLCGQ